MPGDYTYERVTTDDRSLARCAALLRAVFPAAGYDEALVRWQYRQNPAGDSTVSGYDDAGEMTAAIDARDILTQHVFNAAGRETGMTEALRGASLL